MLSPHQKKYLRDFLFATSVSSAHRAISEQKNDEDAGPRTLLYVIAVEAIALPRKRG